VGGGFLKIKATYYSIIISLTKGIDIKWFIKPLSETKKTPPERKKVVEKVK